MRTYRFAVRGLYWIACALLAALVLARGVCNPGIDTYGKAMLVDMVHGAAYKPYVYRVLLPGTVRLLTAATPAETKAAANAFVARTSWARATFERLKWRGDYAVEYGYTLVLMYVALLGFVVTFRYLITGLFRAPALAVDLLPIAALLILPACFRYYTYLYDFPQLCLFTLGLGLLARERWTAFLALYPFACLNKETTILLTVVFAAMYFRSGRMERPRFWRLLAAQLSCFALVKLAVTAAFRGNPGTVAEFQLLHNLEIFVFPYSYSISTAFTTLGVMLMMFYRWSEKPSLLRCGLWILGIELGITFFLGYLDELRDYYEALPVILLLMFHTIAVMMRLDVVVIEPLRWSRDPDAMDARRLGLDDRQNGARRVPVGSGR